MAMPSTDSAIDRQELTRARALLRSPQAKSSALPALGAAAFVAFTALMLATAMVLAPPTTLSHTIKDGVR